MNGRQLRLVSAVSGKKRKYFASCAVSKWMTKKIWFGLSEYWSMSWFGNSRNASWSASANGSTHEKQLETRIVMVRRGTLGIPFAQLWLSQETIEWHVGLLSGHDGMHRWICAQINEYSLATRASRLSLHSIIYLWYSDVCHVLAQVHALLHHTQIRTRRTTNWPQKCMKFTRCPPKHSEIPSRSVPNNYVLNSHRRVKMKEQRETQKKWVAHDIRTCLAASICATSPIEAKSKNNKLDKWWI